MTFSFTDSLSTRKIGITRTKKSPPQSRIKAAHVQGERLPTVDRRSVTFYGRLSYTHTLSFSTQSPPHRGLKRWVLPPQSARYYFLSRVTFLIELPGKIWSRVNDRLDRNQGGQGHAQETVQARRDPSTSADSRTRADRFQ